MRNRFALLLVGCSPLLGISPPLQAAPARWTTSSSLAAPRAAPQGTGALLAILRSEPLERTSRAQDEELLEAPEADLTPFLSAEEMDRFHRYRRPRWMRGIADVAIQAALFWALLGGGFAGRLYSRCARLGERMAQRARTASAGAAVSALDRAWGGGDWPAALLFAAALAALGCAVFWPTSLVFDWLIPRAHGLSAQPLARWLQLSLLELATQALGLAALAFGMWGLLRRVRRLWLWLGVPAGVLVALSGLADPLSLRLRNQLVPLPAGPARAAIEEVLERSGLGPAELDRIDAHRDTLALDAWVLGAGSSRRIILFDTLVDALTPAQLAAVVAHELGHLRDGSRPRRALLAGLAVPLLLAGAVSLLGWAARGRRFGIAAPGDVRGLPLLLCAAWLLATAAGPLANQRARRRELRADLYALDLTRDPESLRGALLQLARKNQLDPSPPAAVAALLSDHPTLARRLGLIEAWEAAARAGSR